MNGGCSSGKWQPCRCFLELNNASTVLGKQWRGSLLHTKHNIRAALGFIQTVVYATCISMLKLNIRLHEISIVNHFLSLDCKLVKIVSNKKPKIIFYKL